jgi:1,4-dihydroxy-2-naphthoate octaprenyltransferase
VRFGERGTLREYRSLLVLAFAVPIAMVVFDWRHVGWLATWLLIASAFALARRVEVTRGPGLNPLLGATAQLGLRYSLLLAGGIVLERWL